MQQIKNKLKVLSAVRFFLYHWLSEFHIRQSVIELHIIYETSLVPILRYGQKHEKHKENLKHFLSIVIAVFIWDFK